MPVYPRVGGGTKWFFGLLKFVTGLSPRGRGNHQIPTIPVMARRSIPAWAGEPPTKARTRTS